MGVGAVFISTLAVTRLEDTDGPPSTQEDLLNHMLQPIVAFVVLGSILIREQIPMNCFASCSCVLDGLSIPFFNVGRRVHTGTLRMGRTLTQRGVNLPEWILSTRRVSMDGNATPADPERPVPGSATPRSNQDKVKQVTIGKDPVASAAPSERSGARFTPDKQTQEVQSIRDTPNEDVDTRAVKNPLSDSADEAPAPDAR